MVRAKPIKQGERYIRPEAPEIVWVIDRLVEIPGLPIHAKLVVEKRRHQTMTMSEVALRNKDLYLQVETPLEKGK